MTLAAITGIVAFKDIVAKVADVDVAKVVVNGFTSDKWPEVKASIITWNAKEEENVMAHLNEAGLAKLKISEDIVTKMEKSSSWWTWRQGTKGKFTLENFALDALKDVVAKVAGVDVAKVAVDGFSTDTCGQK